MAGRRPVWPERPRGGRRRPMEGAIGGPWLCQARRVTEPPRRTAHAGPIMWMFCRKLRKLCKSWKKCARSGFQVGTIIHYASRVVGKPYRSQRNHYDIDPLVSMADAARDAAVRPEPHAVRRGEATLDCRPPAGTILYVGLGKSRCIIGANVSPISGLSPVTIPVTSSQPAPVTKQVTLAMTPCAQTRPLASTGRADATCRPGRLMTAGLMQAAAARPGGQRRAPAHDRPRGTSELENDSPRCRRYSPTHRWQ